MAAKICILDDRTINQIAAGEVIENPASVVKELVENAIDAEADEIVIEIQGSGHQLIRVQDNGCGMSRQDALLCLERHATSKLRNFSDIFLLSTMGFRGEAVPSIASISEMTILTSPKGHNPSGLQPATLIEIAGSKISSCIDTQGFAGTTIEVKSLFFNTPARKKFQKTPSRDAQEIIKIVHQLAMAHPAASFKLMVNGTAELSCSKASFDTYEKRLSEIIGKNMMARMRAVNKTIHGIHVFGFVHDESASFHNRNHQHLYVNNRPVHSLSVSFAVKGAYGPLIEQSRHPAFVLHLTFSRDFIDVNVHPQKKEVRFQDEEKVRKCIVEAVSSALFPESASLSHVQKSKPYTDPFRGYEHSFAPIMSQIGMPHFPKEPLQDSEPLVSTQQNIAHDISYFHLIGTYREYVLMHMHWNEELLKSAPDELKNPGIIIMHVQRALARIAYDDLMAGDQKDRMFVESQNLLVPVFLELQTLEAKYLENMIPCLHNLGFSIREFGQKSFLIEAVPAELVHLDNKEIKEYIVKIASRSDSEADGQSQEARTQQIRRIAEITSKSYRMATPLADDFSRRIIRKLLASPSPFYCPFGKRIFIAIADAEIIRNFT